MARQPQPTFDSEQERTSIDDRQPDGRRPRSASKAPAFVPAETVLPTVSYRGAGAPTAPAGPGQRPPTVPPPLGHQPVAAPVMPVSNDRPSEIDFLPSQRPATVPPPVMPDAYAQQRGQLTVVFGCRGGAGATALAVNTAAALLRGGQLVCLVDLELQLGDVCVALDVAPQTSLASVAREAHALDAASLRRRLAQHGSGLCALSQTDHVEDIDPGLPSRLPGLFDTLRTHFAHVVVDGVRDLGDVALPALEAATRILLVVTQDVPSVRRAARVLTLLARLGIDSSRIHIVLNRTVRRAAIDDAAIERALAKRITARVREDNVVSEALDAGALLLDIARTRGIVDDIEGIAALCRGQTAAPPKRGWFSRKAGG
ncbi:MAG: cellulose synthase operon protein YhjQ/BcsQ [Kofleriaceae bacterium]|nr:cellulose synthase operon protein YhjQ/BcsQ [Kofleriaceae bacterium]